MNNQWTESGGDGLWVTIFHNDLVTHIKSCIFAVFSMRGCRFGGREGGERQGCGGDADGTGTNQQQT